MRVELLGARLSTVTLRYRVRLIYPTPIVRTESPDMGGHLGRVHGRSISAGATGDFLDPVSDDVTHNLVRQQCHLA